MAGEPATSPQLILAFDFGTRRIGLATGDTLTRTARGLSTLDFARGTPWPAIYMEIGRASCRERV